MATRVFDTALLVKASKVTMNQDTLTLEFNSNDLGSLIYKLREEPWSGATVVDVYYEKVSEPGEDCPMLMTNMPAVEIVGFWETARALAYNAADIAAMNAEVDNILDNP